MFVRNVTNKVQLPINEIFPSYITYSFRYENLGYIELIEILLDVRSVTYYYYQG